jgi:hypothetical protein
MVEVVVHFFQYMGAHFQLLRIHPRFGGIHNGLAHGEYPLEKFAPACSDENAFGTLVLRVGYPAHKPLLLQR